MTIANFLYTIVAAASLVGGGYKVVSKVTETIIAVEKLTSGVASIVERLEVLEKTNNMSGIVERLEKLERGSNAVPGPQG